MQFRLDDLVTEQVNPRSQHIDLLATNDILSMINDEDQKIAEVIKLLIPTITQTVELIVDSLSCGGRLFYVGAGSSGRIGLLDALEMPPTYGVHREMIQGILAGGHQATFNPDESVEDNRELGALEMKSHRISSTDIVIGIAASGRTPYVLGAMEYARAAGAKVIGLTNNPNTQMNQIAHLVIEAVTGPEIVLGSTRMKSGTAQKMILNMLSTASMIRLGKVYQNLMVDVKAENGKLVHRAKRIIKIATHADDQIVDQAFEEAGGYVKTAIVMILAQVNRPQAEQLLQQNNGFLRKAVEQANHKQKN